MNEKEFFEIVETLCKHPKLYTPTGSFYEVVSFLEGYASGINVGDSSYHSKFTPFHKWLAEIVNENKVVLNWSDYRQRFKDDKTAFNALKVEYKQFTDNI